MAGRLGEIREDFMKGKFEDRRVGSYFSDGKSRLEKGYQQWNLRKQVNFILDVE